MVMSKSSFGGASRSSKRLSPTWQACIPIAVLIVLFWGVAAHAQDAAPTTEELKIALDTVWVMVAAFLVIFMNAGFAMLEAGFCRQKNAVNILSKNLIVFGLSTIAFWIIGFALMFGDGNPFFGMNGFFLGGDPAKFASLDWTVVPLEAKFLFQLAFAGTAATIVSGAVAERIKFVSFLIFSLVLTGILYPITGHWVWGGGWLSTLGTPFFDFAGSTVVHSVGGWAALTGALILGPRFGRYSERGASAMPGHNMAIATLGCLILWLGWFGFNPGSTMAADPNAIAHIAVTTNLSAAFGGVAATLTAWFYLGKPDLSMTVNGILAGLVGITAVTDSISLGWAAVVGLIAGVIVVFSVTFFDKLKIDDPVGATSVHLVCGIWGTLAVGLFKGEGGLLTGGGPAQLISQIIGIVVIGVFTVITTGITWYVIKAVTGGIRVHQEEEIRGLDISEHGMEAYSGFMKEEMR